MTPETLIWRPGRIRVFSDSMQNPWSRTGSIARDHRAFLQTLTGPDRQEEDEDWEVLAPPRPTRSWTPRVDDSTDWFDPDVFAALPAEMEHDIEEVTAAFTESRQEAAAMRQARREAAQERRRLKAGPWRVTLERERNYRLLSALEEQLHRDGQGHCQWTGSYWSSSTTRLSLIDTKGFIRGLTMKQAVLVLERGEITKETRMAKTCNQPGCLAPEHHKIQ